MRWFWIDRFVEFRAGQSAKAIKTVSMADEHVDQYFPNYPVMPASLVIEGFAQMGGLLVGQQSDFLRRVVLAKISRVQFHCCAEVGDTMHYEVVVKSLQEEGGLVRGTSHIGDRLHAEADLYFAYLTDPGVPAELFDPLGLLRMLRCYRMFEVGVDGQGHPLEVPPHMAEVERQALAHAGPRES
jgi:3-hydroxyacyl-[acyl-carrier-protein] dehydratase